MATIIANGPSIHSFGRKAQPRGGVVSELGEFEPALRIEKAEGRSMNLFLKFSVGFSRMYQK